MKTWWQRNEDWLVGVLVFSNIALPYGCLALVVHGNLFWQIVGGVGIAWFFVCAALLVRQVLLDFG